VIRRYRSGHLGEAIDLYVDGRLDAVSMRCAARHLLVCSVCRRDVDAERAIVREVRAVPVDPDRHASLVAGLLALAPECASRPPSAAPGSCADEAMVLEAAPHRAAAGSREDEIAWQDATRQHPAARRRRSNVRAGLVAGLAGLGSTAACVGAFVLVTPSHSAPMAPERSRMASVGSDRIAPPTIDVAGSREVTHGERVTVSRAGSGRMAP